MTWIHGIEIWEQARASSLRRAQRADVLLANTEYTRARACGLHEGLGHAQVCWLGTEEEGAPPVSQAAFVVPTALILSRLDAGGGYKGHRELIAAWPQVASAVPGARLLIAGDGPGMPVVRAWVQASPVRSQIDLLGFVKKEAIGALWQRASVFSMPSRGEGFGLAYVEAMRHGVPVLGSVHDAAVEINSSGETGFNVNLDTPSDLATRLIELLAARAALQHLSEAARSRWQHHFRYGAFSARFAPLLSELLKH